MDEMDGMYEWMNGINGWDECGLGLALPCAGLLDGWMDGWLWLGLAWLFLGFACFLGWLGWDGWDAWMD